MLDTKAFLLRRTLHWGGDSCEGKGNGSAIVLG